MKTMISLNEIAILPAKKSRIQSRSDVDPYDIDGKLPLFVAPMTCILNDKNFETFEYSLATPIEPVDYFSPNYCAPPTIGVWRALTLKQFKYWFVEGHAENKDFYKVLIDCANGHMSILYDMVRDAKQKYGDHVCIMIGNIANPETYIECCNSGVDYVRVGIGGGGSCTTSVLTGVHASMPYLLSSINILKKQRIARDEFVTKVIADGGIDSIAKIIKCLALGADYVMMGKMFAYCEEAGQLCNDKIHKQYYGQSSHLGQLDRFGKIKSQPEGTVTQIVSKYTLDQLLCEIESALRCAMSYCNAVTLGEFIGNVEIKQQSVNEFVQYEK